MAGTEGVVDFHEPAPGQYDEHGQDGPGGRESVTRPERRDQRRREDRTYGDRAHGEPPKDAETRVRRSFGTIRCRSVKTATSSTLFAAPTTASRKNATIGSGTNASSTSGRPQKTSARPKGVARRTPFREIAASAPMAPPIPIAAVR